MVPAEEPQRHAAEPMDVPSPLPGRDLWRARILLSVLLLSLAAGAVWLVATRDDGQAVVGDAAPGVTVVGPAETVDGPSLDDTAEPESGGSSRSGAAPDPAVQPDADADAELAAQPATDATDRATGAENPDEANAPTSVVTETTVAVGNGASSATATGAQSTTDPDPSSDDLTAPAIEPLDNRTTPAGEGVVLAVRATDAGGNNGALRYGADNLPPGLRIDDQTGVITGAPEEAGSWEVVVRVSKARRVDATVAFTWMVTARTAAERCAVEGQVRSGSSVEEIRFRVTNSSDDAVDVHWLNHSGNRVQNYTMDPGESVEIDSFRTHPWLVAEAETGRCLLLLDGLSNNDQITVN